MSGRQDRKAFQEQLVRLGHKGRKAYKARREQPVPKAIRETLATQGSRGQPALPVL
jgi:hypothetical protein